MSKYIDLTRTLTPEIPVWPGAKRFENVHSGIEGTEIAIGTYGMGSGIGTHMDAPFHWKKSGRKIEDIGLEEVIAPACVIDVRAQVAKDVDYALSVADVEAWEAKHGRIGEGDVVLLYTGWEKYWGDEEAYLGLDSEGVKHFPGFGEESTKLLLERGVAGIGIDAISVDVGTTWNFPVHEWMLGSGKFQIENLCNLGALPARGAKLFALPMKIGNAPEAAVRAIAQIG